MAQHIHIPLVIAMRPFIPQEIIINIALMLCQEDIRAFVLTCRAFYHGGIDRWLEHQGLLRKYCYYSGSNTEFLLHLLNDILKNPFHAGYVKTLQIGRFRSRRQIVYAQSTGLHTRFRRFERLHAPSIQSPIWNEMIRRGGDDPAVALLMLSLPNLSTLSIRGHSSNIPNFHSIISYVVWRSPSTIPKLSHVVFEPHPDDVFTKLELVERLAWIPSVHSITITNARCPLSPLFPQHPWSSNITTLNIDGSSLTADDIAKLLQSFHSLTSFSYVGRSVMQPIWLLPGNRKRRNYVLWTLLAYSGGNLRQLTLRFQSLKRKYIGDLREFKAMRVLEIDLNILVPVKDRKNHDSLANNLPPTIEQLSLHVWWNEAEKDFLVSTLCTLVARKVAKVPSLKEVKIIVQAKKDVLGGPLKDAMRHLESQYEAEGIHFTVQNSDDSFIYDLPVDGGEGSGQAQWGGHGSE